jgi:hypothetical protein
VHEKELLKISLNAGHSGPARVVALYLERHLLRTNQSIRNLIWSGSRQRNNKYINQIMGFKLNSFMAILNYHGKYSFLPLLFGLASPLLYYCLKCRKNHRKKHNQTGD